MNAVMQTSAIVTVRTGTSGKLANPEVPTLDYAIGISEDRAIFIAITRNAEGGYFSQEWIAVSDLLDLLNSLDASNKPFSSKVLLQVFRGKSCNNAGFMTAVLHKEHLIRLADKPFSFLLNDEWNEWIKAQLALESPPESSPEPEAEAEAEAGIVPGTDVPDGAVRQERGKKR
jgi:hypothetical protein